MRLINLDAPEVFVPYKQQELGFGILAPEPMLKPVSSGGNEGRSLAWLLVMIPIVAVLVLAFFALSSILEPIDEMFNPSGDPMLNGRHTGMYLALSVVIAVLLAYHCLRKWLICSFKPTGIILSSRGFRICRRAGLLNLRSALIEWDRCMSISQGQYDYVLRIPGIPESLPVRLEAFDIRLSRLNPLQVLSLLPFMFGMQARTEGGDLIIPIREDCIHSEEERELIESAFDQVIRLCPPDSNQ